MRNYIDDPMDICPMSPSPFARVLETNSKLRFSTRHNPEGPDSRTCTSPICPIKFPHAAGLYLQNGRAPTAQDSTVFGGSNPPKFCWLAYEKCAAGAGTELDIRTVQSFREIHGNSADPWRWAAEDQRWAQQIQNTGLQDGAPSQGFIDGKRGRGGQHGGGHRGGHQADSQAVYQVGNQSTQHRGGHRGGHQGDSQGGNTGG